MRASGHSGELRVGYQRAAELGTWSIVLEPRLPRAYTFTATVQSEHGFWNTQRPLDLVLAVGQTEWAWRNVEPCRTGDTITIELHERPEVCERSQRVGGGTQR